MTGVGGPQERDEVSFGPEGGSRQLSAGDAKDIEARQGGAAADPGHETFGSVECAPVDTWFEPEPVPDKTASRYQQAFRLPQTPVVVERHRTSILLGLWTLTAIALVAAAIGWGTTQDAPTTPAVGRGSGESHGLTSNQAACFAFGRVEGRVEAKLGPVSPVDGGLQRRIVAAEIRNIDTLAQAYPSADYRLIVAFADVANALVRLQNERDPAKLRQLVDSLATANNACRDLASYDLKRASPVQLGD